MTFLAVIGMVAIVTGFALSLYAVRWHGSEMAPRRPSASPRAWTPVWKSRHWFTTDRGFRLYVIGVELIGVGAIIATVVVWLRW